MYDRKKFRSAQNVRDVSFFCSACALSFLDDSITIQTLETLSTVEFFSSYQDHSQHLHFVPSLQLSTCCPGSSPKVGLPWVPSISYDKQNHPLRCLQQGSPHRPP